MIFILGLVTVIWKCQVNFRGFAAAPRSLFTRCYSFLDWCPWFEHGRSTSGGFSAVRRSLFKRWYSFLDWWPWFESVRSISRGVRLLLGLCSQDVIHSWTGAHDLKVSGQFQGGFAAVLRSLVKSWYSFLDWCPWFESARSISGVLQLFLGLFSKDDIHIWSGAHDFLFCQVNFRGPCSCS